MTCEQQDLLALKIKLAEAETAYHQLSIGSKRASVGFGPSKSVSFTQANISDLRRYINELKSQIAELTGCAKNQRKPVRFRF